MAIWRWSAQLENSGHTWSKLDFVSVLTSVIMAAQVMVVCRAGGPGPLNANPARGASSSMRPLGLLSTRRLNSRLTRCAHPLRQACMDRGVLALQGLPVLTGRGKGLLGQPRGAVRAGIRKAPSRPAPGERRRRLPSPRPHDSAQAASWRHPAPLPAPCLLPQAARGPVDSASRRRRRR